MRVFPRPALRGGTDAASPPVRNSEPMDEKLLADRVAWSRENARHRYIGALWAADDTIRLAGRDEFGGLEVSLAIPLDELSGVHVDAHGREPVPGQPCLVLTLASSPAIIVWAFGDLALQLPELAAVLEDILAGGSGDGAGSGAVYALA